MTGGIAGGAVWITAAYNTDHGCPEMAGDGAEGISARDVVVDATRVYVTGQALRMPALRD